MVASDYPANLKFHGRPAEAAGLRSAFVSARQNGARRNESAVSGLGSAERQHALQVAGVGYVTKPF